MKFCLTWALATTFLQALVHAPTASAKFRNPSNVQLQNRHLGKKVPLPLPDGLKSNFQHPPVPPISSYHPGKNNAEDEGERIVGGEPVSGPGVYPFYVSWDDSCGGSLIHSDIILSAAHCNDVISSNNITINAYRLGDSTTTGAELRSIVERAPHPSYDSITLANDFVLLKLDSPVTTVQPIPLNDATTIPVTRQNLTVIGLGTVTEGGFQPDLLQEVTVQAVSDSECNENYDGYIIEDVMLCAGVDGGGKSVCHGDSGGPIFTVTASGVVDKQVGVVSWGFGCAIPDFPAVYAEVSAVDDWIFNEICRLSNDKPEDCPPPTPAPTPGEDETEIDVNVLTDIFPWEVSWSLTDDTGTVLASVALGTYGFENYLYTESAIIKKGVQHRFTIQDSYSDGLCCAYGEGMWSVTTSGGVLASGAEYGASDTAMILVPMEASPTPAPTEIPAVPPPECEDTNGTIYVDLEAGNQTCSWLNVNIERYGYLCQFVDVAVACPGTCDWCDLLG